MLIGLVYDLRDDLGETRNLADTHPGRVRELAAELERRLRETGAQLSLDRERGEPIPGPREALGPR